MSALICGSIAYDTIMVFQDRFKNHILPDKMHILNVSFLVPEMRREFGGCAGNIAYNLKLLGGDPLHHGDRRRRFRAVRALAGTAGASTCAHVTSARRAATPRRPSSPPTWTTTRSRPFIPGAMNFSHAQPRRRRRRT